MYKIYFLISFFCITDFRIFIFIAKADSSVSFAKVTSTAYQIECLLLFRIHMIILVFHDFLILLLAPSNNILSIPVLALTIASMVLELLIDRFPL